MAPEETHDFERAVSQARERLNDLSPLMVAAHRLDQAADLPQRLGRSEQEEDGSAA